jgi:hypothetical protein
MRVIVDRFAVIDPGEDGAARLRDWLNDYLPFHTRYLGIMRAWLEGTSRDPRLLSVVRRVTRDMHVAALTVLARVDRPYPLDAGVAAVIQGALLERIPEAALEQDGDRPAGEIVELIAQVMERGLYNPGPTR